MDVRITILVENTTPAPTLLGEYGFSTLVEVNGKNYLFDTGNGAALLPNARALGIDLSGIEALIISHGHFDHTGSVPEVLSMINKPVLYAHSGVFTRHMVLDGLSQTRYIGAGFSKDDLTRAGAKFIAVDDFSALDYNVYITGAIPRHTDYEDPGGPFVKEQHGEIVPDPIEDDMAMVIAHPQGLIIISGCAHAGIINMMDYAIQCTGESRILAFIGGTHLVNADENRLKKTIARLKAINPQKLIVCHCTGFAAASRLLHELPAMTVKGETGMAFQF